MKLVERVESCRVALSGLIQQALICALRRGPLCWTSDGHHGSGYSNCRGVQKVTVVKAGRPSGRFEGPILPRGAHGYRLLPRRHVCAATGLEGFRPAFLSLARTGFLRRHTVANEINHLPVP